MKGLTKNVQGSQLILTFSIPLLPPQTPCGEKPQMRKNIDSDIIYSMVFLKVRSPFRNSCVEQRGAHYLT